MKLQPDSQMSFVESQCWLSRSRILKGCLGLVNVYPSRLSKLKRLVVLLRVRMISGVTSSVESLASYCRRKELMVL